MQFETEYRSKPPLRWIVDFIVHPFAHYFFSKGLKISFKYENKEMPSSAYKRMNMYYRIYSFINKPYDKWGTTYCYRPEHSFIDFSEEIDKEDL